MKTKDGVERPWLFRGIRTLEAVGLVVLCYGLASSRWIVAGAGAVLTASSYAIYLRHFPRIPPDSGTTMGPGEGD